MAVKSYGSLFERLAGEVDKRAGLTHEQCLMASIAAHLRKMLSTRAGSVQALPDYGLPDLNDMSKSLHDTLTHSRGAIELFIQNYEPRLADVQVTFQSDNPDAFRLLFTIAGIVEVRGIKRPAVFNARLSGSGEVDVRYS